MKGGIRVKGWMKHLFLRLGVRRAEQAESPNSDRLITEIIEGLRELAFGGDASPLPLLPHPGEALPKGSGEYDLRHISRLKLSKEGAIEAEFVDRYRAIQMLLELALRQEPKRDTTGFYTALENAAKALGRTENGCGSTASVKNS